MRTSIWLVMLSMIATCTNANGGEWPFGSKAPLRGILPNYDYRSRRESPPVRGPTFTSIPLQAGDVFVVERTDDGLKVRERPLKARTWQLKVPELRIDHCSISRAAVTVREDGYWIVNLRASQNPFTNGPRRDALPQVRFKRNRFHVEVRAYGAAQIAEPEGLELGKPELFHIDLKPFWVERNDVRSIRRYGYLFPQQRQFFDGVDRMEVELRYE